MIEDRQINLFFELLKQRKKDIQEQLKEVENNMDSISRFLKECRLNEIEYLLNMFQIIVLGLNNKNEDT